MSWIRMVEPSQAPEDVRASFGSGDSSPSQSAALWQILALDPAALPLATDLERTLFADGSLSPAEAEMVAVVVSATNGCVYCVTRHGRRLAQALGDEALARAVAVDYRQTDLPARTRVLLDYAVALTCEPAERKREDVERMREYGFDDAAILRATEITAFVGATNRIASGLGVELEPGTAPWEFAAPV